MESHRDSCQGQTHPKNRKHSMQKRELGRHFGIKKEVMKKVNVTKV